MIVDLKDKILKTFDLDEVSVHTNNTNKEEALSALEVLGFARETIRKSDFIYFKNTPRSFCRAIDKISIKEFIDP